MIFNAELCDTKLWNIVISGTRLYVSMRCFDRKYVVILGLTRHTTILIQSKCMIAYGWLLVHFN